MVMMVTMQHDDEDNDKNITVTPDDDCHPPRHHS